MKQQRELEEEGFSGFLRWAHELEEEGEKKYEYGFFVKPLCSDKNRASIVDKGKEPKEIKIGGFVEISWILV